MWANWIHIMIVHLAVIGTPYLLYRVIAFRKHPLDEKKWRANYIGLILLGISSALAYFTGPEAADWIKAILPSYSQELVEDHALWGRASFVILVIAAFIGIMGLASTLQDEKPYAQIPIILIVLLAINTILILYTAHLGGMIRRLDLVLS